MMKDQIIYLDDSTDIHHVNISLDYISFYSNVEIRTDLFLNYCIHINSDKLFFKILKEKIYVEIYVDKQYRYHLYRNFGSITIFKAEDVESYEAEMRCMKIVKMLN